MVLKSSESMDGAVVSALTIFFLGGTAALITRTSFLGLFGYGYKKDDVTDNIIREVICLGNKSNEGSIRIPKSTVLPSHTSIPEMTPIMNVETAQLHLPTVLLHLPHSDFSSPPSPALCSSSIVRSLSSHGSIFGRISKSTNWKL